MTGDLCLACKGNYPKAWDSIAGKNVWLRYEVAEGYISPFCSQVCMDAFASWPEDQKQRAMVGNTYTLPSLTEGIGSGRIKRDSAGAVSYRYHPTESWQEMKLLKPCLSYDASHADNTNRKIVEKICAGCGRFRLTLLKVIRQEAGRD